jgi:hypothetical protein
MVLTIITVLLTLTILITMKVCCQKYLWTKVLTILDKVRGQGRTTR